jgi:metal-responsive CopG/Arc/MetJ family transcriptional regulator
MRTIIDLPQEQIEGLDRLKSDDHPSRAALIRQAVAAYLRDTLDANTESSNCFGVWRDNPETQNALDYQQKLRSEWHS